MGITKIQELKIILLVALAQAGDNFISIAKIAEEKRLPLPFLRAVARELISQALIESKEGKNGGYRLAKQIEEISLAEILKKDKFFRIPCERGNCQLVGHCPVFSTWQQAENKMSELFSKVKLSDFLNI